MPAICLPSHADRVLVSVNPRAGARSADERVRRLVGLLDHSGLKTEIHADLGEVAARAAELHRQDRLRALVAVGGDGTVAELVNRTPPGTPIAILPAGTENLLARHGGFPLPPEPLAAAICRGRIRRLDAGQAGGRIFLLMLGAGFDAAVVHRFHGRRSGHISRLDYLSSILHEAVHYPFPEIRVYWRPESEPGEAVEWDVRWLFAFNLPCYGGGFRLCPQADGSDGLLDVCGFAPGGFWAGLRLTLLAGLGRHQRSADWTTARVRRLHLSSPEPVPYQLDGDPAGTLPLDVEVLPERLTLLEP